MSKRYVYVLRNDAIPPRYYTGVTSDAARRCAEHNAGRCSHTAKSGPWSIDVVIYPKILPQRRGDVLLVHPPLT